MIATSFTRFIVDIYNIEWINAVFSLLLLKILVITRLSEITSSGKAFRSYQVSVWLIQYCVQVLTAPLPYSIVGMANSVSIDRGSMVFLVCCPHQNSKQNYLK